MREGAEVRLRPGDRERLEGVVSDRKSLRSQGGLRHPPLRHLHRQRCDSGAAARSTVDALTFRAVTRTLLFDQTWRSSTKVMLLVSSEASAKSPLRAPGAVTSMFAVTPGPRLGRPQVVSSARLRVPTGTAGQPQSTAGAASGSPNGYSASSSICPSKPTIPTCAKATLAPRAVAAVDGRTVVAVFCVCTDVGLEKIQPVALGQVPEEFPEGAERTP